MMKKITLFLISFAIIQSIVQSYPYPASPSSSGGYNEPQEPIPVTHDGGIYDPVVQVDLDLNAGVPGQDIPGLGAPAPSGSSGGGGGGGGHGGGHGGGGGSSGTHWWDWWFNFPGFNSNNGGGSGGSSGSFGTHWWDWWLKPLFGWIKWFWGLFFPNLKG